MRVKRQTVGASFDTWGRYTLGTAKADADADHNLHISNSIPSHVSRWRQESKYPLVFE